MGYVCTFRVFSMNLNSELHVNYFVLILVVVLQNVQL